MVFVDIEFNRDLASFVLGAIYVSLLRNAEKRLVFNFVFALEVVPSLTEYEENVFPNDFGLQTRIHMIGLLCFQNAFVPRLRNIAHLFHSQKSI